MTLACGFGMRDITPPHGLPMGGYAARSAVAAGTLDRLYCRTLVISAGNTAAVLVSLDLLCVAQPWAATLRSAIAQQVRCDAATVLVAATHTHAGPAVFRSALIQSPALEAYERQLAAVVLDTVGDACAALLPGRVAHGQAVVRSVAANRREQQGWVDDTVRVLVAQAPGGRILSVAAVFGCHPTLLPPSNLHYSRDLFGTAVDLAETRVGAPVILFNGAAADVSTRFTRRRQDAAEVQRLGRILGDAIASAVQTAEPRGDATVDGCVEGVPIRLRQFPTTETAERVVAECAARLQGAHRDQADEAARRQATALLEGALAQLFLATHGGAEGFLGRRPNAAPIQLLRVAGCDILGVPGEVFSRAGHQICAQRRRPTLLIGYANDYLGYLVDPDDRRGGGYESLTALVEAASAQDIARRLALIDVDSGLSL